MTTSFVGAASAEATSVTLPAHQAGDLIVLCAANTTNTNLTPPAGWFVIRENGTTVGGSRRMMLAYKNAASASETSGTWTNATFVAVSIYRHTTNILSLGGNNFNQGSSNLINFNSLVGRTNITTVAKLWAASSWVVGIAIVTSNAEAAEVAPSGMTNRTSTAGASAGEIAIHDTNGNVASYSAANVTLVNSVGWNTYVAEIIDTGGAKTSGGMLVHPGMSGGMRG